MRIVFLGPPGVGKGTQSSLLASVIKVPAISTGDIFRAHVTEKTPLGQEVSMIVGGGGYVPDSITNRMVADRLAQGDVRDGFLLDGYPRTVPQVTALEELLASAGKSLDAVVLIDASSELVVRRIAARALVEGRSDDTPEVIRTRLEAYASESRAVIEQYEALGLLRRVAGEGAVEDISTEIARQLGIAPV